MITEDYVSFETAKLLKEKGFDYASFYCYEEKGINDILLVILSAPLSNSDLDNTIEPHKCYSAPTLQMAMKWLRDVHHLVIQIEFIDFLEHGEVWLYSIIERKTIKQLTGRDEDFTEHSYEEACEVAIKYCLEKLI